MDSIGKKSIVATYLHNLIPASGDDDGVLGVGAEADAGNPVGVALVGDGELAVTQGVPELDGAVTRAGDDLAVVGREGNGKDIVVVANEGTGGVSAGKLPEAEGLVPGSGQSVGTVRGDDLHKTACQPIFLLIQSPQTWIMDFADGIDIRSQRRCGNGPGGCAWGNRRPARRG